MSLLNSLTQKPSLLILCVSNSLPWFIWSIISFFNDHIAPSSLKSNYIIAIVFSSFQLTYPLPTIITWCAIKNRVDLSLMRRFSCQSMRPTSILFSRSYLHHFLSHLFLPSLKFKVSASDNCGSHFSQMCTRMPSIF